MFHSDPSNESRQTCIDPSMSSSTCHFSVSADSSKNELRHPDQLTGFRDWSHFHFASTFSAPAA